MKRRILIVEDDEIFLRPLQRSLEVARYDVLIAPSGEDAIDLLKREDADLVLTDKRLPGMDGVELVRRIKGEHPDLAMVVMTAYGTIESAVESVRLGAADYLVKPFEVAELLIVVRNAIELTELRAANRATLRRNEERFTLKNVVARSGAMQEVFELLRSVADLDTTNKDLQAEVERGTFRRDLFYRLSVMPIRVPPLRERVEDIPLLAQHFLEASARRSKKVMRAIAPGAMQSLCRGAWPGNVRELENVIERAVIVSKSDTLTDIDRFLTGEGERGRVDLSLPFRDAKARVVEEFERAYIGGVLEAQSGKLTAAAKHADMDPKNFSEKLARYGLRKAAASEDAS